MSFTLNNHTKIICTPYYYLLFLNKIEYFLLKIEKTPPCTVKNIVDFYIIIIFDNRGFLYIQIH